MGDVAQEGRTVLFVSHNMAAITNLCHRALLLIEGQKSEDNVASVVIDTYLNALAIGKPNSDLENEGNHKGNGMLRFIEVWLEDDEGRRIPTARSGQMVIICARYKLHIEPEKVSDLMVSFSVQSIKGHRTSQLNSRINHTKFGPHIPDAGTIRCIVPKLPLNMGQYNIGIYSEINGQIADSVPDSLLMHVEPSTYFNVGMEMNEIYSFFIDHSWRIKQTLLKK